MGAAERKAKEYAVGIKVVLLSTDLGGIWLRYCMLCRFGGNLIPSPKAGGRIMHAISRSIFLSAKAKVMTSTGDWYHRVTDEGGMVHETTPKQGPIATLPAANKGE